MKMLSSCFLYAYAMGILLKNSIDFSQGCLFNVSLFVYSRENCVCVCVCWKVAIKGGNHKRIKKNVTVTCAISFIISVQAKGFDNKMVKCVNIDLSPLKTKVLLVFPLVSDPILWHLSEAVLFCDKGLVIFFVFEIIWKRHHMDKQVSLSILLKRTFRSYRKCVASKKKLLRTDLRQILIQIRFADATLQKRPIKFMWSLS